MQARIASETTKSFANTRKKKKKKKTKKKRQNKNMEKIYQFL